MRVLEVDKSIRVRRSELQDTCARPFGAEIGRLRRGGTAMLRTLCRADPGGVLPVPLTLWVPETLSWLVRLQFGTR